MIPVPTGVRIWIATGHTDMRKGMQGLALLVQESLGRDPFAGDVLVFRGACRLSDESAVARWNWIVALCQATGPWTFCVARHGGRCCGADRSADELSAGSDRLAQSAAHVAAPQSAG